MIVESATVTLYAPWVNSLKEKRMVVKSIIDKMSGRFNISIAALADSMIESILLFIENNTDAEIIKIQRETR